MKPFDTTELNNLVLPAVWNESEGRQKWTDAQVKEQMGKDGSPLDKPQPPVEIEGKSFMFTGKFSFGTRKDCEAAIEAKGGIASKSKSPSSVDYLAIGENGNPTWKKGSYGSKIEKAIIARSKKGKPAIVGELH